MQVNKYDVTRFLKSLSPDFRNRLINRTDPGRVITLMQFQEFLNASLNSLDSIAVVSGSLNEPELLFVGEPLNVSVLSFDENPTLFDLTRDWSFPEWSEYHNAFDLVLCEQVLEHVLDPKRAFENLRLILKPGGLLHITVPAINNSHGEPFYFYAGFPPATLTAFAQDAGLSVLVSSSWMSDKGSRMYSTCDWAPISHSGSIRFLLHGLWASRNSGEAGLRILFGRLRNFFRYPFQRLLRAGKQKNAVVTYLWAKKPIEGTLEGVSQTPN
jgi:SAM-dependent methyltransferase